MFLRGLKKFFSFLPLFLLLLIDNNNNNCFVLSFWLMSSFPLFLLMKHRQQKPTVLFCETVPLPCSLTPSLSHLHGELWAHNQEPTLSTSFEEWEYIPGFSDKKRPQFKGLLPGSSPDFIHCSWSLYQIARASAWHEKWMMTENAVNSHDRETGGKDRHQVLLASFHHTEWPEFDIPALFLF